MALCGALVEAGAVKGLREGRRGASLQEHVDAAASLLRVACDALEAQHGTLRRLRGLAAGAEGGAGSPSGLGATERRQMLKVGASCL